MRAHHLILCAQMLCRFANGAVAMAMPLIAAKQADISPIGMSYLSMANAAPYVFLAPVLGRLADGVSRRSMMMVTDGLRCILSAAVAYQLVGERIEIVHLVAIALTVSVLSLSFEVAFAGALAELTPAADLPKTNALMQTGNSLADAGGSVIAGYLLGSYGYWTVFAICSPIYAIGFTCIVASPKPTASVSAANASKTRESEGGFRSIFGDVRIRTLLCSMAVWNSLQAALMALLVLFLVRELHLPSDSVGMSFACGSAGMFLSGVLGVKFRKVGADARMIGVAILLCSLAWMLIANAGVIGGGSRLIAGMFVIWGIGMVIGAIASGVLKQSAIPTNLQSRLSSLGLWMNWTGMIAGSFLGGALGESLGVAWAMKAFSTLMLLPSAVLIFVMVKHHSTAGRPIGKKA